MMMMNMLALLVSLFAMALSAPVQSKMVAVRKEDLGKTLAKLEAKVEEMVQEQGHVEKKTPGVPGIPGIPGIPGGYVP